MWATSSLGEAIEDGAAEDAEAESEEVAELMVEEEVLAEVTIDLAAAVPRSPRSACCSPSLLIQLLDKTFELHLEIDNLTDHDLRWTLEYQYNGGMTAQPASPVLPSMGRATDAWGDKTVVDVIYEANFSSTNRSGFEGTGFACGSHPRT